MHVISSYTHEEIYKKHTTPPSSPHAELTDTCTLFQSICTDFHAKSFPLLSPPSASLSCLGQQVRWRSLLNTGTVCCDILHCSSSLTGVALYPELDVPALKLFLVATWGTPPIQTDSSEGIRFALLSLAGLWQRRQRAVFPLDLWWINETNHSANKGFFLKKPFKFDCVGLQRRTSEAAAHRRRKDK